MGDKVSYSHAASDINRFVKSKFVSTVDNDGNRVFVLQVPRKGFVKTVKIEVKTGFTAASTGTVTVGIKTPDVDTPAYFMDDTVVASEVTGMKSSDKCIYCEKGGSITISLAKGTSAADVSCRIFADISTIY